MIKVLQHIPADLWLILIMATLIHLFMKIQLDARDNKIAAKEMFTSWNTLLTIIISILCSVTLLVIGYSGYERYLIKNPTSENPFMAGLVAALIGYSSSSFFLNLMKLTESKVFTMLGLSQKTMRTLILLLSLFITSCTSGQVTTYTVHKGKTYCEPSIGGGAGEKLGFFFTLKKSWSQLYENTDNSTHKISGISDIFGRNSIRLGVRRADTFKDGLIACPYIHNQGKFTYTAFKDSTGKNLLLKYETRYFCQISKIGNAWSITIYEGQTKIAYDIAQINISSIGRRRSGMYVEVGSGPSLWDIQTEIEFIK